MAPRGADLFDIFGSCLKWERERGLILRRAKMRPRTLAPNMSDALLAQGFMLLIYLVACLNLILIGALAWTKS